MNYLITKYYIGKRACASICVLDALDEADALAKAKISLPNAFTTHNVRYTITPYTCDKDTLDKPTIIKTKE